MRQRDNRYSAAFIYEMLMLLGLPIVVWGAGNLSGYLSHPARLALAVGVLVRALLTGLLPLFVPGTDIGFRGRGAPNLLKQQGLALQLAIAASVFGDRHDIAAMPDLAAVRYPGLILCGLATGWVYWVVVTTLPQLDQEGDWKPRGQLIATGPYQVIRYPYCLGFIAFTLGFVLVFRSWAGLALTLFLVWVSIRQIHYVEAQMTEAYDILWVYYAKETWLLIPYIF